MRVPQDPAERERLAVLMYDLRAVSQGRAAKIAGLMRSAFFDALGRHGVTPYQYDDVEEALADLKTLADAKARADVQAALWTPANALIYAVDASPLIGLAKVGRLDLLTVGVWQVQVTETVYQEVLTGDANDPARLALHTGAVAILDDADARRAARAAGIPHVGTTGLVVEGKRLGLVTSARDTLCALSQANIFLPREPILRALLATVGETWP